jgi:putative hydrolase of the HAD superfamily
MIKAVIFDVDNTLIDFLRMKRISCEEAVNAMIDAGLEIDKEKAMEIIYEIYKKEGMEDKHIFQKFLRRTVGKVDYRMLSYAIIAYRQVRGGFLKPYPGTKRTLIRLKEMGMKLAVVTDAPKLKAWIRLASMKLDDFFDVIIALEDTGRLKPSKMPFRAALQKLRLKPAECIMVGDFPERDIRGAKKMGMKTALAKYGYSLDKPSRIMPDHEIEDITELADIVKNLNKNLEQKAGLHR